MYSVFFPPSASVPSSPHCSQDIHSPSSMIIFFISFCIVPCSVSKKTRYLLFAIILGVGIAYLYLPKEKDAKFYHLLHLLLRGISSGILLNSLQSIGSSLLLFILVFFHSWIYNTLDGLFCTRWYVMTLFLIDSHRRRPSAPLKKGIVIDSRMIDCRENGRKFSRKCSPPRRYRQKQHQICIEA